MKIKHPKKSLGQNFLTDKNIVNIIINVGDIKKNDTILEVGSGTGNLTERILSKNPRKYINESLFQNEQKERVIADFIAGMTDRYAINLHKKIK